MAIKDFFKVSRKTFFDPRGWSNYDSVKAQTASFFRLIRETFSTQTPTKVKAESYEDAIARLKLTPADIKKRKKTYRRFSIFFLALGIGILIFSIVLLFRLYITSFILGLAVASLSFAQAFKFHFWYFQIKHKKLGCTFEEWRQGKVHTQS